MKLGIKTHMEIEHFRRQLPPCIHQGEVAPCAHQGRAAPMCQQGRVAPCSYRRPSCTVTDLLMASSIYSKTSNEPCSGILIHSGTVDDGPCLTSVSQSAQRLLDMGTRRTDRCQHHCLGVTSEALLQQPATPARCL